jgi:hypothetical protein
MAKQYNIDTILTQDWTKAQCELCGALERAGGLRSPGALNATETTFLAAFNCWGGIECDGLNGWLANLSDPQMLKQAVEAFRAVGAVKRADELWHVAGLFPGAVLPEDPQEFAGVVSDDQHEDLYSEIEDQMSEENIDALLHRYVTEHVQGFK